MQNNLSERDKESLTALIAKKKSGRLYTVSEEGNVYEMEMDTFTLDLYETICFDKTLGWVIYGSHEYTITFGGDWLVEAVRNRFTSRPEKLNNWEY